MSSFKIRNVHFGLPKDKELLIFLPRLGNFSGWVKDQISREIAYQKTGIDPVLEQKLFEKLEVMIDHRIANLQLQQPSTAAETNGSIARDLLGNLKEYFNISSN